MLSDAKVSIYQSADPYYPQVPPYHPPEDYPEHPFHGFAAVDSTNTAYAAVRESLILLGLDIQRSGKSGWNPLSEVIIPGNTVVIKPNAVWDINLNRDETVFASITHGAVLRAVIDYAYKALDGKGRLIIADAPIAHSDFDNWKRVTGIDGIVSFYREVANFTIEVYDLRQLYAPWDQQNNFAPSHLRQHASRDPAGYLQVDLGAASEFSDLGGVACRLLYGSDYNRSHTVQHHINGHHRYCVAKTFLEADVVISVPKLKVHAKVGVTVNIKGMVGTQGDKNYIPHHRVGIPARGGDEHPDLGVVQNLVNRYRMWLMTGVLAYENKWVDLIYKLLYPFQRGGQCIADILGYIKVGKNYKGNIIGGSWYGNDTAWRMALDLIHIILYVDQGGRLCDSPQRQFFCVVDGIVGGEGEGPLSPVAKPCRVILAGFNPLAVDMVAARLMGFDPLKIRMLQEALLRPWIKLWSGMQEGVQVVSNRSLFSALMTSNESFFNFVPPKGWYGRIEIGNAEDTTKL
jgi:uncharacterized protein (DUF362 family)